MPSGYTCIIGDDNATFEQFIMRCARAFGAMILLRDEPIDAPIPEFTASTYHVDALAKARDRLRVVERMSDDECIIAAQQEFAEAVASAEQSRAKDATLAERYSAMLSRVEAWTPPTTDHEGLKKFMQEQITESLRFDCSYSPSAPELLTGMAWRAAQLSKAARDVQYYTDEDAKERQLTDERNAWVKALRESVPRV